MKKGFIDQIMLALFLFVALIVLGATVADNALARDKYYSLKKLTDNAVLSMAKYYVNINEDTDEAEAVAELMLDETNLGLQIKDNIIYDWDFSTDPATVTATINDYTHETFWFRFLDVTSFNLKARSIANINTGGDLTSTANLLPFGINGCNESHLTPDANLVFDLRGERGYSNSNYTEFYGIDQGNACSASGNSNWAHFKNEIKDFYVEDNILLNDLEKYDVTTDSPLCIPSVKKLMFEQDNDPKQISQSFMNLENTYDLVGVQADIAMFECGSTASNLIIKKFITVEFNSSPYSSYINTSKGTYDQFQFDVKIIGSTIPNTVILED